MTGTLTAPDHATAERIKAAVVPGRTAVWIERDRVIWWGGIIWTTALGSTTRGAPAKAEIQAGTFDSYLDHRLLAADLTAKDEDQFDLVRRLVGFARSSEGGDIGIRLGTARSGVTRTRKYSRYDLSKLRELLDKLAGVENGFEWRIRCYRTDAGERVKELQLGHPRIATSRGRAETVLDFPGPVMSYRFPYDATTRATHWQSRGATNSTTNRPLMSTPLHITGAIDAGWPRLDGTSDYTTITTKRALDEHAAADLTEAWTRATVPEITVNLEAAHLTPAILGATIRLRIADVWTTAGVGRYRVVGFTVRAPERGQPETATLTLDAATHSAIGNDGS
ncbi:putative phage tail protein [Streptomyces sp. NBRC 110611]|nr:putative phage tail protein [Streptomyces sp. NBRC 110611]